MSTLSTTTTEFRSPEYHQIRQFYSDRTAKRSGVPLMNHIDEGLIILLRINATQAAQEAFCLHPLFQHDDDLAREHWRVEAFGEIMNKRSVFLAMEYRNIANQFLSGKVLMESKDWGDSRGGFNVVTKAEEIPLSPIKEVNDMLIADKVQNRKDFIRHHLDTHANAARLDAYFKLWMERLGISDAEYERLTEGL